MNISKRTWIIVIISIMAVIALGVSLFFILSDGEAEPSHDHKETVKEDKDRKKDTLMYSENYLISEKQMQYLYFNYYTAFINSYSSYLSTLGLDTGKPLTEQTCAIATEEEGGEMTWYEYIMDAVIQQMRQTLALAEDAKENGFELSEEDLAYIDTTMLNIDMDEYGIEGLQESDLRSVLELSLLATNYEAKLKGDIVIEETDMQEYYQEHEDERDDSETKSVRHILLEVDEDADEETKAEVRKQAEDLLQQWKEGEATESSFAALVYDNTADTGSKETGGLYENFPKGQMVEPFENWAFDENRKKGDTDIVETPYGYHIMYFVGDGIPAWRATAEQTLQSQALEQTLKDIETRHEVTARDDIIKTVEGYAETVIF